MIIPHSRLAKIAIWTYPLRVLVRGFGRLVTRVLDTRIVLVVGASRSGTTFLGKLLSLGDQTEYLHEPVKPLTQAKWKRVNKTLDLDEFWAKISDPEQVRFGLHALNVLTIYLALRNVRAKKVYIIKPIVLIGGFEQAADVTRGQVVFISRHPCGRAESIKRQWEMIGRTTQTPLEDLKHLGDEWGESHRSAINVFERHPDWIWVKFEDVCDQPEPVAEDLYRRLNLEWTPAISESVRQMTSVHSDGFYETNRQAQSQIDKWQGSLSSDEVEIIRDSVRAYGTGLYDGF